MMDRYHLRYFLAVIDQGNFSKAALACNVSQPTLSAGISKLEATLGQRLFLRTNRRVELTGAGADLVSYARRIEAEFVSAERIVAGAIAAETVRLGLLVTTPSTWLERFLRDYRALGATDRVAIFEARERELHEKLANGRIDAALTIVRSESDPSHHDALFAEGYSLAMSSQHRLAGRHTIAAEELIGEPMIVRRQCEVLTQTSQHFTSRGVRPFFPARTTSDERALSYVRCNLGITVMPNCYEGPGIVRPKLTDFPLTRTIGLVYGRHVDVNTIRHGPIIKTLLRAVGEITLFGQHRDGLNTPD
jgi:DNA-binding transcriptional LysR family regulator